MLAKKINKYCMKKLKAIWNQPMFCVQIFCMLVFIVPNILYICRYSGGVKEISESILPLISAALGLIKYTTLFYKRTDLSALLQNLQTEWDHRVLNTQHPDKNVIRANNYSQRISLGYIFLMLSISGSVVIIPSIIMLFEKFFGTSQATLALPLKADFIIDTTTDPGHTIVCLLMTCCLVVSTIANSGGDCIFVALSLHVAAHIQSLRGSLKNIGKINKINENCGCRKCKKRENYDGLKYKIHPKLFICRLRKYLPQYVVTAQLKECIYRHNEMIEYVRRLEGIFSHQSTAQFLSSSLTICLILFQITCNVNDSRKILAFLLYLIGTTLQLYMFAWYGQILINETSMVADAAYDCPWYNYSPRFRKSLLLVILRAQRPSGISASKFYYTSVESFAKIINATASYFTLLKRFKNM